MLSPVVITNYAYAFLDLNYDDEGFDSRELMICDEAHNVENQIMNLLSLEFTEKELREDVNLKVSDDEIDSLKKKGYQFWISFIRRVIEQYTSQIRLFENLVNREPKNMNYLQKLDALKNRVDEFYRVIRFIEKDPLNWVFDYNKTFKILAFEPIKIDKYARSVFFNYADICIFMSATILDYKLFAKWLGIDESEIYAIRRKSPFNVARNPIKTYYQYDYNMTRNYIDDSINRCIPTLKNIINQHKNEKGIIHTHSHRNKGIIFNKLSVDASIRLRLITHESYDREKKLNQFINSKEPSILISPSMGEGVDLPGDLCRFQIILKIPYPYLGDTQVKKRTDIEDEWYKFQTVLSLVQTYGRGMRSENDYCKTYFIDSGLENFILRDELSSGFIPSFFKNAIGVIPANVNQTVETKSVSVNGLGKSRTKEEVLANANRISKAIDDKRERDSGISAADVGKVIVDEREMTGGISVDGVGKVIVDEREMTGGISVGARSKATGISVDGVGKSGKRKRTKGISARDKPDIPKTKSKPKQSTSIIKDNITYVPLDDFSNKNQIKEKYDLIQKIDDNFYESYYNLVIDACKQYLDSKLFKEDYYLYKMLVRSFDKLKEYDGELEYIKKFYSSNIHCSENQILWFERQLLKLQKRFRLKDNEVKKIINLLDEPRKTDLKTDIPVADRISHNGKSIRVIDENDYIKLEEIKYIDERASDLRSEKRYEDAIQLYNKSIDNGLVDFSFYQGLCACYEKLNQYGEALNVLRLYDEKPPLIQKTNHKKWIRRKQGELEKKVK